MNAKLACMGGLRELENKNYDIAAMKFVSVKLQLNHFHYN